MAEGRLNHRSRRELAWTAGWFVAIQLAIVVGMEVFRPGAFDREYMARRDLLEERQAERPEADTLLFVGSSRVGLGFVPGEMRPLAGPEGRPVIPFNYSHLGAGPRSNYVRTNRLLRGGLKPRWVILESIPGGLSHEGVPASLASFGDLPALLRHASSSKVLSIYARERLNVIHKHRQFLLEAFAPAFVTRGAMSDAVILEPLGDDRRWMRREDLPKEKKEALARDAEWTYRKRMEAWTVDPLLDRATRDLIAACRDRGAIVVVVITPEDSRFHSWYSDESKSRINKYYADLAKELGAMIIDGRTWVTDDGFDDPHHLNLAGAKQFTGRLERDVVEPMVHGRDLTATTWRP